MSFKNSLLKIVQLTPKPVYNKHNPTGLNVHHLNEHKFNCNFSGCVNPLCPSSLEVESSSHFFPYYYYHKDIRKTLFDE